MKLGYPIRKKVIVLVNQAKRFINLMFYLSWLLFDPSKFKLVKHKKIRSLLVIALGKAIGDFFILLGTLNKLKESYPALKIYLFCLEKNKKFIKNPSIQFVDLKQAEEMINNQLIDALISYTVLLKRKVYTKVPYRVSMEELNVKELKKLPMLATRRVFPYHGGVLRMILSLEALGFNINRELSFCFTKEAEADAEKFFKKNNISKQDKLVFLHPGSARALQSSKEGKTPASDWPTERWVEVANKLINKPKVRIIFTGVKEEKPAIAKIISQIKDKKRVLDTSGELSIELVASILKRGTLLICVDTSLAHIGAQCGISIIDLFGPYNPKLSHPWTDKLVTVFHSEACNSCRRYACPEGAPQCMRSITVKEVLDAADKRLKV